MSSAKTRTNLNRRTLLAAAGSASTALAAPAAVRAQGGARELRMATAWPKGSAGARRQRAAARRYDHCDVGWPPDGARLRRRRVGSPVCGVRRRFGRARRHAAFHAALCRRQEPGVPVLWQRAVLGLTAHEHLGWLRFGGGQALWEEAYAPAGVQPLVGGTTGPQAGGWFRKEIKSLADLNGLRMRAGGFGGVVLKGMGVDAILTPPGEIAAAMESGKLDAVEWNGPWNDREAGLHKLAPFYYMPGVLEIGPMLEASINKHVFEKFGADLQEIVRRASLASAFETYADFTYHNAVNYELLLREGVRRCARSPPT